VKVTLDHVQFWTIYISGTELSIFASREFIRQFVMHLLVIM